METQDNLFKITTRFVLVAIIVTVLIVGKSFFVPFTWSLIIGLSSHKLIEWFQNKTRMPLGLIIFLWLIFILITLFSIGYFFYFELNRIFADLPAILEKVSESLNSLSETFKKIGIPLPEHIDKSFISDWVGQHQEIIKNFVSAFGMNIWNIVMVMFYLFFLLYYKDLVPQFLSAHAKDKRNLVAVRHRTQRSLNLARNYIYGMMVLTLISATMNLIVFFVFGLKFALFFAVFIAILNLIPFIGNPIGLSIIFLFSLITKDNMFVPLMIVLSMFFINFVLENVIRPKIIGDKLEMNAFSVFVAIIIGEMIWGVSGMILFIPLVGILKIYLESSNSFKNYTIFFSDLPKKEKTKRKETTAEQ